MSVVRRKPVANISILYHIKQSDAVYFFLLTVWHKSLLSAPEADTA